MERDLFGSMLFLALQRKIDMGEALKFSLTPFLFVCPILMDQCKNLPKVRCLKGKKHELHPKPVPVLIIS